MRTEDILNLDCTIHSAQKKLNSFLWKVKPVSKLLTKAGHTKEDIAPLQILEESLHGICAYYSFRTQGIDSYYEREEHKEKEEFKFYTTSILNKQNNTSIWIGNVYGKTLWEVVAKSIIKIYGEILKERK